MMFALGFVFLSFVAYVIQDWRRLMIFVSLMYIPFLTMYRYEYKSKYTLASLCVPITRNANPM